MLRSRILMIIMDVRCTGDGKCSYRIQEVHKVTFEDYLASSAAAAVGFPVLDVSDDREFARGLLTTFRAGVGGVTGGRFSARLFKPSIVCRILLAFGFGVRSCSQMVYTLSSPGRRMTQLLSS